MKNIALIILMLCSFLTTSAQQQKLNEIFDQYQNKEGITSIKIGKAMFGMLNKLDISSSELDQIKPLLSKINGLKILIIEDQNKNNLVSSQILNSVNKLNYEELVTINNANAKVKFLSAEAKDGLLNNLLLNINNEGNTVLMMLDGQVSLDDVNKIVDNTQQVINNQKEVNASTREKEIRNVNTFNGIKVSNAIKVFFKQDDKQEVSVEAKSDQLQYIKTEVKNGILNIYVDTKGKKITTINNIIVEISAPKLESLYSSSASQFYTKNTVIGDKLNIDVSSAAQINGDFANKLTYIETSSGSKASLNIKTNTANFKGSSASKVTLNGRADTLTIETSSASSLDAYQFNVQNVDIKATSASSANLNIANQITGEATSGAIIKYRGQADQSNFKTSSGAKISKEK